MASRRELNNPIIASPNQASTVFGVGGAHPIRQKSLFIMRFLRKVGEGGDDWKDGLSFIVKSIDRPAVQPTVEEINQYNRKRMIQTGVKYQPVTCTLYDTADGAALGLWVQYASYHFGDYRQAPGNYNDDILNPLMTGGKNGYGFGIAETSTSSPEGINSQFFFDRVEVYQVWGNEYTAYHLINPKINAFTPDDLDYENSNASMITMSLSYEGIYHENGGKPVNLMENAFLVETFGGQLSGETFDPVDSGNRLTAFTSTEGLPDQALRDADIANILKRGIGTQVNFENIRSETTTSSGGSLSKFGNFDFGDFKSLGSDLPTEMSVVAGSHDGLQAALGDNIGAMPEISDALRVSSQLTGTSPIDQVAEDFSDVLPVSEEMNGNWYTLVGPEEPDPIPATTDAMITSGLGKAKKGRLSLSSVTMATVNIRSDGSSQIGRRKRSAVNPLLSYIVEPQPVKTLMADLAYGRVIKVSIIVASAMYADARPSPVIGSINKQITVGRTLTGYSTASGFVDAMVHINGALEVYSPPIGNIASSFNMTTVATGVSLVMGSINKSITIGKSIAGRVTPSGHLNKSITISANAQGNVSGRAGTMYGPITIYTNATGLVDVIGTIQKSITITSNMLIVFPIDATLDKTITVTCVSAGKYIAVREGTIAKTITISSAISGLVTNPISASLSEMIEITPSALGNHIIPRYGSVASDIVMTSSGACFVVTFGTFDKSITVLPTITGLVNPIGVIDASMVVAMDSLASNLVTGTMESPISVGLTFSGASDTNTSPAHRYWRIKSNTNQAYIGPNEIEFHTVIGGAPVNVGGTAMASASYNSSYLPGNAYDRDGLSWWSSPNGGGNGWVGYDFGSGNDREIVEVLLATSDSARVISDFKVQFSDDSIYWYDSFSAIVPAPANNKIYVATSSAVTEYEIMYRLRALAAPPSGNYAGYAKIALYNNNGALIPSMSPFANGTSYGTATAAFDGDPVSNWVSGVDGSTANIGFYAGSLDTTISTLTLRAGPNAGDGLKALTSFVIEVSNNSGTTWTEIYREEGINAFADGEQRTFTVMGTVDVGGGNLLAVNNAGDLLGY